MWLCKKNLAFLNITTSSSSSRISSVNSKSSKNSERNKNVLKFAILNLSRARMERAWWKIPFHSVHGNFGNANRKFWSNGKRPFSPHFSAFVASYGAAPKKCTSLPEQSVTLVPSTPRACKFTSLSYMKTNFFKKTVNVVRKSIV